MKLKVGMQAPDILSGYRQGKEKNTVRIKKTAWLMSVLLLGQWSAAADGFAWDWKALHERADTSSLEEAQQQVSANPHSAEAQYVLGIVSLNRYDTEKARGAFLFSHRLAPEEYEPVWGFAEVMRRDHHLEQSGLILREMIDQHPDFVPAYLTLSYIKFIQRDFSEGAHLCAAAMPKAGDPMNVLRLHTLYAGHKGMIAHFGGPLSKGINGAGVLRHLRIAQKIDPNNPLVLAGTGSYYLLVPVFFGRDLDKAQEYLERAISKDPHLVMAYVRLAQVHQLKGNREKYDEYLDQALACDPADEVALDIKNGTCRFICVEK
jgi:tetratricopeptide (TPR) repeat protein